MGKTLSINSANFSSVSIGKVDIPRELLEMTKAWIGASGNTNLTINQKNVLDEFVGNIVDGGIYNLLEKIYLPMLASDVSKSLVNYKVLSVDGSMSVFNNDVELNTHGLQKASGGTFQINAFDSDYTISSDDFSLFVFTNKTVSDSNTQLNSVSIGASNSGEGIYYLGLLQPASMANSLTIEGNTSFIYDNKEGYGEPNMRGGIGNGTTLSLINCDGSFTSVNYPDSYTQTDYQGLRVLAGGAPYIMQPNGTPIGAIFIGRAMTAAQAEILQNAIKALFEAINV